MIANWQIIANIATSIGIIVATSALIWQIRTSVLEERLRRSEFCLREVIGAFEEAHRLLADGNNDRITWIAAARILEKTEQIGMEITHRTHRDVIEIQKDRYRRVFGNVLGHNNPDIPPGFFYGVSLQRHNIDEAAKASTTQEGGRSRLASIPESVLFSIWRFAQYPDDYEDPLPEHRFPDEKVESRTMHVIWPGLTEYLKHTRHFQSINGQLVKRNR